VEKDVCWGCRGFLGSDLKQIVVYSVAVGLREEEGGRGLGGLGGLGGSTASGGANLWSMPLEDQDRGGVWTLEVTRVRCATCGLGSVANERDTTGRPAVQVLRASNRRASHAATPARSLLRQGWGSMP